MVGNVKSENMNDVPLFVTDVQFVKFVTYAYTSSTTYISDTKMIRIFLQETYELEDLFYANLLEHSNTGGWGSISTNINNLPSNFELTADLYTTGVSTGSEQRVFLCPSPTWNGNSQPSQGIWIGFNSPNKAEYGYRNNSSNWFTYSVSDMNNKYHSFKVIRNGSSWSFYVNNNLVATKSYSNMSSYSEFTFCWINWYSGSTFKFKNLKIKKL